MKKKLSVLFFLSVIAGSGFTLYKSRSPDEKTPIDLARETSVSPVPAEQKQTAGTVPDETTVLKKGKKPTSRHIPVVTE
jgi:hypothetical protein